MSLKNILPEVLLMVALAMITISFKASILPPGLTGLGFIIAYILKSNKL